MKKYIPRTKKKNVTITVFSTMKNTSVCTYTRADNQEKVRAHIAGSLFCMFDL